MFTSRLVVARRALPSRSLSTVTRSAVTRGSGSSLLLTAAAVTGGGVYVCSTTTKTQLDARRGDDILSVGTPVKEPATGIVFPQLCNGFFLAGVGHRVKYVFVKVYAVGSYFDPLAMSAVAKNKGALEKALVDPTYPRTLRLVMARGLSVDKFTAAIVEALEPRMKGQELEKLEEFKKLNPPIDLVEGAVIEMTIRGDTMIYKNATGSVGSIKSEVFTAAMCDTYFGSDAVSPTLKESVMEGIPKL